MASEGWVTPVARVGNVVTSRARPAAPTPSLTRDAIVRAAIVMADAEGLSAVSLRGLAARMGAPVTSLYRHVDGKEALVRAMTDAVLDEGPLARASASESARSDTWRHALELAARAHFRTLRRHPWLVRSLHITRPRPLPGAIAYADWILGALELPGVDAQLRMQLHVLLHAYVQGLGVNVEAEAEARGETGLDDDQWMHGELAAFDRLAASGRYPAFARTLGALEGGFDLELEALFEQGLAALLDGFERIVARAADGQRGTKSARRATTKSEAPKRGGSSRKTTSPASSGGQ